MQLKNRLTHSFDIVRGPYKTRGTPELRIVTRAERRKSIFRKVKLPQIQDGIEIGEHDFLQIYIQYVQDQLSLRLPSGSVLQQAGLVGWKAVWDGSQATLAQVKGEPANTRYLEVMIPTRGMWRVSNLAASTEIFVCHTGISSHSSGSIFVQLRRQMKGAVKYLPLAIACHSAVFLLFLYKSQTIEMLSKLLPQPEVSEMASAPAAAPVEVLQNDSVDEDAFNGRSLFAPRVVEEKEKVAKNELNTDVLKAKLKSLSHLMRTSLPIQVRAGVKQPSSGNSLANALANSLGQLHGEMGNSGGTLPSANALPSGAPKVKWKPQFLARGDGKGSDLSDGQERQLLEEFAKLQERFRDCFEKALLEFDELSVSVNFEGVISPGGKIGSPKFMVNGRSTERSQNVLTQCLSKVIAEMSVDKKSAGIRIKRQFIFK